MFHSGLNNCFYLQFVRVLHNWSEVCFAPCSAEMSLALHIDCKKHGWRHHDVTHWFLDCRFDSSIVTIWLLPSWIWLSPSVIFGDRNVSSSLVSVMHLQFIVNCHNAKCKFSLAKTDLHGPLERMHFLTDFTFQTGSYYSLGFAITGQLCHTTTFPAVKHMLCSCTAHIA